jgi:hypothetical protein
MGMCSKILLEGKFFVVVSFFDCCFFLINSAFCIFVSITNYDREDNPVLSVSLSIPPQYAKAIFTFPPWVKSIQSDSAVDTVVCQTFTRADFKSVQTVIRYEEL